MNSILIYRRGLRLHSLLLPTVPYILRDFGLEMSRASKCIQVREIPRLHSVRVNLCLSSFEFYVALLLHRAQSSCSDSADVEGMKLS